MKKFLHTTEPMYTFDKVNKSWGNMHIKLLHDNLPNYMECYKFKPTQWSTCTLLHCVDSMQKDLHNYLKGSVVCLI